MRILLFAVLILAPAPAFSAEGRTGGLLFGQGYGARAYSLGRAYTALADDAFGMSYNPASLARLKDSQAATQFMKGIVDTRLGYGVFATPLNPTQAIGLGAAYLDLGKETVYDEAARDTGQVAAQRDLMVSAGYAHGFTTPAGRLSLGLSGKFLRSEIFEDAAALAYAADAGAVLARPLWRGEVAAAASASNLGPKISYSGGLASGGEADPLPLTLRTGVGFMMPVFSADRIAIGLELDQEPYEDVLESAVGFEYIYHGVCALRAGYGSGRSGPRVSVGAGVRVAGIQVDYGLGVVESFSNVHQISLTYRFTIPGIRYDASTPAQRLIQNIRDFIDSGKLFQAWDELDRLAAAFPERTEPARLRASLQAAAVRTGAGGPGTAGYSYGIALRHYRSGAWEDAALALEAALRQEPGNREVQQYLERTRKNLSEQKDRLKLQRQATIAGLYELASQAFEARDFDRARRILREILKVSPYQPARDLESRIKAAEKAEKAAERRAAKGRRAKRQAARAAERLRAASAPNAALAEKLYNEALIGYAQIVNEEDPARVMERLKAARSKLQDGLKLDPLNEFIGSSLRIVEREMEALSRRAGPEK